MDARLVKLYDRELNHLREMGAEFAREFPKIAGRLALEQFSCEDPYVERLLEGFAFLAARVQLKLEAEFPRFTQGLLRSVYPHYLNPTPACCILNYEIEPIDQALIAGFKIPRGSVARSALGPGDRTACEFRTAHALTLRPLAVTAASYTVRQLSALNLPTGLEGVRAGVQIRLATTNGMPFSKLPAFDSISLYVNATPGIQAALYESLVGRAKQVYLQSTAKPVKWRRSMPAASSITARGFDDADALMPLGPRSYSGYRLLQELFAIPNRFYFVDIGGLSSLAELNESSVDIIITLDRAVDELEGTVQADNLLLNCTPAINLFPKRADRVQLTEASGDHLISVDRTRPKDFEIYDVTSVVGIGESAEDLREFRPIYAARDSLTKPSGTSTRKARPTNAYFTLHRTARLETFVEHRKGPRSSYAGSELFISLVDASEAPVSLDVRQLAIDVLCTNRDLPILMSPSIPLVIDGGPIRNVRLVGGPPTPPRASPPDGEISWRSISHLSLNYLSLIERNGNDGTLSPDAGAAGLRDLLSLYADLGDPAIKRMIEGIRRVTAAPVVRRIHTRGPIAFARGMRVTIEIDETAFTGSSAFLLGAVLERFFAGYTSINSFVETVVNTTQRGEVMSWPSRSSTRHLL